MQAVWSGPSMRTFGCARTICCVRKLQQLWAAATWQEVAQASRTGRTSAWFLDLGSKGLGFIA